MTATPPPQQQATQPPIAEIDVGRAIGILNAASRGGMYPPGGIPEDDANKIVEAEKLVVLAQQCEKVVQTIGEANVPNWPVAKEVLAEAGLLLGIGSPPGPATPGYTAAQEPVAPAPDLGPEAGTQGEAPVETPPPADMQAVADTTGRAVEGSSFLDPPGTNFRAEPGGAGPVQTGQPQPSPSASPVAPPAAANDYEPKKDEVALDHDGNEWMVTSYGGGPQLEARSIATGEVTVLPAGFLKQRSPNQPANTPAPAATAPPALPVEPAAPAATAAEVDPPPQPVQAPQAPAPTPSVPDKQQNQADVAAPVDDDEGDEQYREVLEQAERDFAPRAMPVPMDLESPPPTMPEDLTTISDIPARALHSQFNALAARARYLAGFEEAKARGCRRIRRHHLRGAMQEARKALGKSATVTELELHIESTDDAVSMWTARQERHEERAASYKTLFSIYTENVSVLSRDWTMRSLEEAHS